MAKVTLRYDVCGNNFITAGEASGDVKRRLRTMGVANDIIRRAAIAMYEAEMNMVIHADGGNAEVVIDDEKISMVMQDKGPGILDVETAMKEGFSTAGKSVRDLGFGAGMGLPNMKRYADEMYVTSEPGFGTRVEMTVYLTPRDN